MTDTQRICWYCGHWVCPDWCDLDSHGGASDCAGTCAQHPGRHEATDVCDDWCDGSTATRKPRADTRRGGCRNYDQSRRDGWAAASCLLLVVLVLAWTALLIKWLWDAMNIVARALAR